MVFRFALLPYGNAVRYSVIMSSAHANTEKPSARGAIAANVDAEFTRKRWTKRRAAIALGMSHVYVSRRTSGEVELSGSDLATFAAFLAVPVQTFFVGLPELDSNQQPAGFTLRPVTNLPTHATEHTADVLPFRPRAA